LASGVWRLASGVRQVASGKGGQGQDGRPLLVPLSGLRFASLLLFAQGLLRAGQSVGQGERRLDKAQQVGAVVIRLPQVLPGAVQARQRRGWVREQAVGKRQDAGEQRPGQRQDAPLTSRCLQHGAGEVAQGRGRCQKKVVGSALLLAEQDPQGQQQV